MKRGRKSPVVHVIAYRKDEKSPVQLRVTPDPLDMTQYGRGPFVITWKLDTKGYHFPPEGVAIEFTSPGWEKSFFNQKVEPRRVTVVNANRDGLAFAYNVHVVDKTTGDRVFLDPVIQNEW
jgi:hypothetical protein